jgi:hypothetical protein
VLGTNKWGGGPATVGFFHQGHWLGDSLIGNQFAGVNNKHINQMTINPFLFYNLPATNQESLSRPHRQIPPRGHGSHSQ